ncbi:uncharacterized protein LOC119083502 [Bradysia coprophila]|uniref:uncharacterized protein LOC119083502 n=1 Tax=Bradysia coprophila TaxID=38358 RepID=UPI00187D8FC7|nr:uncharacterized protein LOC119083502 [Bradysia coprophila]
MNKNNLEFDVVSVDQKNLESLIVFQVQQISSFVRRISVGQFIKSSPFELQFPISIGRSKWILFLFLNGQYEAGEANEMISIYLMLDQCEHQSAEFKFDVKFQFGESATVVRKNQRLCFESVKERWFGANIMKITDMILNDSRLIRDDVLTLTVSLNEILKEEPCSSPELFSDNNYSFLSESYLKSENKYTDPPDRSTKPVSPAQKSNKSMFREEPYARALLLHKTSNTPSPGNSPQSTATYNTWNTPTTRTKSDNAIASTNETGQAYRRDRLRDSNLNYVEYSDDEDAKSSESKKGIRDYLRNFFAKLN